MTATAPSARRHPGAIDTAHSDSRVLGTPPDGQQGPREVRELQRHHHRRRGRHAVGHRRDRRDIAQHRQRTARRPRSRQTSSTPKPPRRDIRLDSPCGPTARRTFSTATWTIKGNTRPVTLNLEFNGASSGMGNGEVSRLRSVSVINRKDFSASTWTCRWRPVAPGDKVTITLDIEAVKQVA